METKYTIATTIYLRVINAFAVENNLNRAMSDEGIDMLDPDGIHVLVFVWNLDDGATMRSQWMVKMQGDDRPVTVFIDIAPHTAAHLLLSTLRRVSPSELSHPATTVQEKTTQSSNR